MTCAITRCYCKMGSAVDRKAKQPTIYAKSSHFYSHILVHMLVFSTPQASRLFHNRQGKMKKLTYT